MQQEVPVIWMIESTLLNDYCPKGAIKFRKISQAALQKIQRLTKLKNG